MTYEEKYKRIQQEFEQRLKDEMDKTNSVSEKYELLNVYFDEVSANFAKMLQNLTKEKGYTYRTETGMGLVFRIFKRSKNCGRIRTAGKQNGR